MIYLKEYLEKENEEIVFKSGLHDSFRIGIKDSNNITKRWNVFFNLENIEEVIIMKIMPVTINIKISSEYLNYLKLKFNLQIKL